MMLCRSHRIQRACNPFFFSGSSTPEIYTLSLHDALPIYSPRSPGVSGGPMSRVLSTLLAFAFLAQALPSSAQTGDRSEEHTSELQSRLHIVCRLLLEKKKSMLPLA